MNGGVDVYRLFDANSELLYVGVSWSALHRSESHRQEQPWWNEVTRIEVQHFDTREEGIDAERSIIESENPKHNRHHSPERKPRREIVRHNSSPTTTPETRARLKAASVVERNKAIVDARREGASLREIAAEVGLTHAGVAKIINHAHMGLGGGVTAYQTIESGSGPIEPGPPIITINQTKDTP